MLTDYQLTLNNRSYPALLKEIHNPPQILYIKTKKRVNTLFKKPAVAIVGTRNSTSYGRVATCKITSQLVKRGFTIVSGLARGIDILAHKTAILENGLTIAVLGSGIDRIYPPEHIPVAQEIIKNGAIISEFPLGTRALPGNFPIRNRVISGLSLGVVVVEAGVKSGAMITVSYAAEQGREVFAIPGPITSPYSQGTNELIKKGAKLVTDISDILEELPK